MSKYFKIENPMCGRIKICYYNELSSIFSIFFPFFVFNMYLFYNAKIILICLHQYCKSWLD